eukprot:scaffold15167_cov23-Tisochrysis_lutea.AAC.1
MALHDGQVAEMATGEGKTLVATLPSYLNALTGQSVHVVTQALGVPCRLGERRWGSELRAASVRWTVRAGEQRGRWGSELKAKHTMYVVDWFERRRWGSELRAASVRYTMRTGERRKRSELEVRAASIRCTMRNAERRRRLGLELSTANAGLSALSTVSKRFA